MHVYHCSLTYKLIFPIGFKGSWYMLLT